MLSALMERGLQGDALKGAYATLDQLHRVVHSHNLINYYEEETQYVERVLNIFIRLNSGGTVLSYSDLLLSIAVAQWKRVDARAEIHKLVDELNRIGAGFALSQDFVLKAGLMLADIASVGFKVENFTSANMAALEANWPAIRTALLGTVELAATFGLNGQTLRADSALLPIAYYLYRQKVPANYATHSKFAADRETIQGWLIRSLLKASGIWRLIGFFTLSGGRGGGPALSKNYFNGGCRRGQVIGHGAFCPRAAAGSVRGSIRLPGGRRYNPVGP